MVDSYLQKYRDRLIVALDVSNCEEAEKLVKELGDEVSFYKIGAELIYHGGLELARKLKQNGKKIFIDAKLHDIPRTVLSAAQNVEDYCDADILTVHCNASCLEAFRIYQKELKKQNKKSHMKWCFVTVLTSENEYDLRKIQIRRKVPYHVKDLAENVLKIGARGLVASVQEAKILREKFGNDFTLITPGIRPKGAKADDQKRIATPTEAIQNGSDYLVVGRPITQAANKKQIAHDIIEEMANAIAQRELLPDATAKIIDTSSDRRSSGKVFSPTQEMYPAF